MFSGACKYCGCTDGAACPGGCCWVDPEQTICSACLKLISMEDLGAMADTELTAMGDVMVDLSISTTSLFAIIGVLQFTLSDPDMPPTIKEIVESFIEQTQQGAFAFAPGVSEMIQRNFEPRYDVAAGAQPTSRLILPE